MTLGCPNGCITVDCPRCRHLVRQWESDSFFACILYAFFFFLGMEVGMFMERIS